MLLLLRPLCSYWLQGGGRSFLLGLIHSSRSGKSQSSVLSHATSKMAASMPSSPRAAFAGVPVAAVGAPAGTHAFCTPHYSFGMTVGSVYVDQCTGMPFCSPLIQFKDNINDYLRGLQTVVHG